MESIELRDAICRVLDDNKALDITILDVQELTVVADYFVICTAKSTKQVKALAELVTDKLEELGETPSHIDGLTDGKWAVIDYGDIIVHIFNDETRMFYCLEKLWSDGKNLKEYVLPEV